VDRTLSIENKENMMREQEIQMSNFTNAFYPSPLVRDFNESHFLNSYFSEGNSLALSPLNSVSKKMPESDKRMIVKKIPSVPISYDKIENHLMTPISSSRKTHNKASCDFDGLPLFITLSPNHIPFQTIFQPRPNIQSDKLNQISHHSSKEIFEIPTYLFVPDLDCASSEVSSPKVKFRFPAYLYLPDLDCASSKLSRTFA